MAYCTRARAFRNYHLARIREAYLLEIPYTPQEEFDPLKHAAATLGRVAGDDREIVLLRLLPAASKWVKEKMWHFTQKFDRLLDDGSVVFRMELLRDEATREALRRWILQMGNEAEVLEPVWLRKQIAEALEAGVRLYSAASNTNP
jgi:predicted DNA-binding transcriptional regulator YafY